MTKKELLEEICKMTREEVYDNLHARMDQMAREFDRLAQEEEEDEINKAYFEGQKMGLMRAIVIMNKYFLWVKK